MPSMSVLIPPYKRISARRRHPLDRKPAYVAALLVVIWVAIGRALECSFMARGYLTKRRS